MGRYTLTSDKWEGDITLAFHDNGFLATAELPEVFDLKSAEYFAQHFPMHETALGFYRANSRVRITQLQADTSFDSFWDAYGKKAGSKELARLYWDGDKKTINRRPITLTDREAIIGLAARYSRRYQGDKKEYQPLATSFLNGRMWEAELEATPRKPEVDFASLWAKK